MSTKFELPFDTCFACIQKSDDNCACKSRKIYEKGKADGYSQAEKDYYKQTEKDRQSSYDCGYQKGRADAIEEYKPKLLAFICKKYNIPLIDMSCSVDEFEQRLRK